MSYFDNLQARINPLNPRSYIYSCNNSQTLLLKSDLIETRLTFSNALTSFVQSASNNAFVLSQNGIPQVSVAGTVNPQLTVFGGVNACNVSISQLSRKQIVLADYDGATQFAGFGYTGAGLYYQTPNSVGRHVFQTMGFANMAQELMRVQNGTLMPQVGIGLTGATVIEDATALKVGGTTRIIGDLIVTGGITLLNASSSCNLSLQSGSALPSSLMPNNIVYVSGVTNKIDSSLIPSDTSSVFPFMRTQKNVGIGTAKPAQKLHVQGSFVASDRVGIATTVPSSRLHVIENAANISTVRLENNVGGNLIESYSSGAPVMFVYGGDSPAVSIGTSNPDPADAFTVMGNTNISGYLGLGQGVESTLFDGLSLIDRTTSAPLFQFSYMENAMTCNATPVRVLNLKTPVIAQQYIATNNIVPCEGTTVAISGNMTVSGGTQLGSSPFVAADCNNVFSKTSITNAMSNVNLLNGYNVTWMNGQTSASLLANEVSNILPNAYATMPNGTAGLQYDAIIPLLIEAVKEYGIVNSNGTNINLEAYIDSKISQTVSNVIAQVDQMIANLSQVQLQAQIDNINQNISQIQSVNQSTSSAQAQVQMQIDQMNQNISQVVSDNQSIFFAISQGQTQIDNINQSITSAQAQTQTVIAQLSQSTSSAQAQVQMQIDHMNQSISQIQAVNQSTSSAQAQVQMQIDQMNQNISQIKAMLYVPGP